MKISVEVMKNLSLVACTGNRAVIVEKLERNDYVAVNKVLEALGGKWSRKDKAHLFPSDAAALLDAAMIAGEVTTKRDIGFFPTPMPLAHGLVAELHVKAGEIALEPSAGTGNIVRALCEAGAKVHAVERDEAMRRALQKDEGRHPNLVAVGDCEDFMLYSLMRGQIDVVAMNPPFCTVGIGNHLDHVRHAFDLLKVGGRLGAVMPSGIQFREDARHKEFRKFVADNDGVIDSLPPLSFRESGTDVNTCLVLIQKGAR